MQTLELAPVAVAPPLVEIDRESRRIAWLFLAALAPPVGYALARIVGLGPPTGPFAWWPVNGILCGIFFRRTYRDWPHIAALAVITQVSAIFIARGDLAAGATVIGAILGVNQAALAALCLRLVSKDLNPLERPRDLAFFLCFAVVVAPMLTTPLSSIAYSRAFDMKWHEAWVPLFTGNSLSILIFAPPIFYLWRKAELRGPRRAKELERAIGQVAIVVVALAVFAADSSPARFAMRPYVLFPLLVWCAVRCGPRWTSFVIVEIATIAAWCSAHGLGPFAVHDALLEETIFEYQAFAALVAITGIVLLALSEEARRAFHQIWLESSVRDGFFNSSGSAVALKDLSGRIALANEAYAALFRMSSDKLVGRRVSDIVPVEFAERIRQREQLVMERGEAMTFDETYVMDGVTHASVVTRFPVRRADGVIEYIGTVGRDVTHERELHERLHRGQQVAMVGHLAAGVVHDLNNLLGTISMSAHLARENKHRDGGTDELLTGVEEAANRAARLTRRLLALGRPQPAAVAEISVDGTIRELEPVLRVLARGLVELRLDLRGGDRMVLADPLTIEQVVLNLVSNAHDAVGESGTITITTRLCPRSALPAESVAGSDAKEWICVEVSDTGKGMSAETLSSIFQAFYSTKGSLGTGLGLYTSALLVQAAGGHIRAESELGKGTRIKIELPAVPGHSELFVNSGTTQR